MTLTMTIVRVVEPKELTSMIYGTGGLSYPWWQDVAWIRTGPEHPDGTRLSLRDHDIDEALETDVFEFEVDDPDEPEGSGKTLKRLVTMEQLIEATVAAITAGNVYDADAINDDIGYCDAPQADCIMQRAVFGEVVYG
jgi:hypothetical protein